MTLNTPVSQDHHAPKARAADGLDSVQSGLTAVIRRPSAWQPPRVDNHRLALDPLRFRVRSQGLRRQTYPPNNVTQRLKTGATGHDEGNEILTRPLHSCTRAPSVSTRHWIVSIVAKAHWVVRHPARRHVSSNTEAAECRNTRN